MEHDDHNNLMELAAEWEREAEAEALADAILEQLLIEMEMDNA